MAFEYPDIMNDVLDARQRYESGVVQYLAAVPEDPIPAGEVVRVPLYLQSVMDVPVKVAIHVALPELNRRLKRLSQPLFQVLQPDIGLTLSPAEVAELVIPVHIRSHVPPDAYRMALQVRSEPEQQGMRVRGQQGTDRVGDIKIRHPQGLHIAQLSSWGFETQQSAAQAFSLQVEEGEAPPEEVDLKPQFNSLWVPQDWDLFASARQESNERRIYAVPDLTKESLYLPFLRESQALFDGSGIQLHVGEAIFVAKILTYTVTYLMGNAEWQDCLLVPIYAYTQATGQPSDDAVRVVTQLGYTHVLELATAVSFALVEDILGQIPWSAAEQRAAREYVADSLGEGTTLSAVFLYVPLILGGIAVADEIILDGEDVAESLRLLSKAKAARADLFAADDLRDLNDIYDRLIARKARGQTRS